MTKKIKALTETIYNLENDVYPYNWFSENQCNCGILARTLLGGELASSCGLRHSTVLDTVGAFSRYTLCMTTDLPLLKVFQVLKDAGFSHQEMRELEYLGNEKIAARIGLTIYSDCGVNMIESRVYKNKNILISYLKAWVEILKEQEPVIEQPVIAIQPETKVIHVYHSVEVDRTIKEQSEQLLMN